MKLAFALTLLMLATVASADPAPAPAALRPALEVRETTRDAGDVEEGAVARYLFVLVNRGRENLVISQVKADCGCSVARWDRVIKPGAESIIETELRTDNLRGSVTKGFTVFSNDPEQPELRLSVKARIIPLIEISPGPAAILAVGEEPAAHEFTLERRGGQPMQIVQIMPNARFLRAEATPLPGEGRYKLTVTALPEAPMGRSVVPLVVKTDLPKGGTVSLILTVDRGIVSVPPVLFCGLMPKDLPAPRQASVTITRHAGPFRVKEATVDDPKLTAKLETVREGAEYRVTITYAGGWEPGYVAKTLVVTTDDPRQPVLQIPVQAMIQASPASRPPARSSTPNPAG